MDAGAWLTLVSIVVGLATLVVGGYIRQLHKQVDDRDHKLELAEKALEAKSETVDELRRQVDRYQITAEIQDRFFKQIPPAPSGER
jgi:flagellar biosynthesis chaperone FliJ